MKAGLFSTLFLFVPGILSLNSTQECKELMDVVAVVDGSDSISNKNFDILKNVLKTLVNDLNIGDGETRLSVILYSSNITEAIPFSDDRASLLRQIATLEHARDGTNTAAAIDAMNKIIAYSGRKGVPKVGIVITDGLSKEPELTKIRANEARAAKTDVFAVGVTDKVNIAELKSIASSDSQVLMVNKFINLETVLQKIVLRSCPEQCKDYLEVVALVDGSDSIAVDDFDKLKLALASLVQDIKVAEGKTRLGLILYSSTVVRSIPLSFDKQYLLDQIENLPHPRDGTETALGLAEMNRMLTNDARPGVKKIGLVITDGISKSRTDTLYEAAILKEKLDVNMFTIGITNDVDVTELAGVASLDRNILTIDIFDDLQHILQNAVRMFCPLPECKSSLDVLTVVDGSDSITGKDFEELRKSLKNLVSDLQIGNSESRFGLILYSSNITAVISFSNDKNKILSEIDALSHPRDGTETALALRRMIDLFTRSGRSFIRKVGIVITDGISKNPTQTKVIAQSAKSSGINMFAVGVSDKINEQELADIASNGQVMSADSFLSLSRSLMDVVRKACPQDVPISPTTTETVPTTVQSSETSTDTELSDSPMPSSTQIIISTDFTTQPPQTSATPTQTTDATTRLSTPVQTTDRTTDATTRSSVRVQTTDQTTDATTRLSTSLQTTDTSTTPTETTLSSTQNVPITDPQFSFSATPSGITPATLDPCNGCQFSNGVYFNNHPTNCKKFIECLDIGNGKYTWIEKDCPVELYWNQDLLTCVYPENVNCTNDPCFNKQQFSTISQQGNCRQYYVCINGISISQCCVSGTQFNSVTGSCTTSTTCNDFCGYPDPATLVCDRRAIENDSTSYEQEVIGFGWMRMQCGAGTAFNSTTCYCSSFAEEVNAGQPAPPGTFTDSPLGSSTEAVCRAELYLSFNDNFVVDESGKGIYIQNNGVTVDDGAGYFDGQSFLRIPRFTNVDFRGKLTIMFKYRVDGFVRDQQALITNSDCGKEGSLYIVSDPEKVSFGVTTAENASISLSSTSPLSSFDWNEVEYQYRDGLLNGTLNGISKLQTVGGSIQRNHYALQIGRGDLFSNFKGWIDELYVYMC